MKKKMSLEEFVRNNRGISDQGKDLPQYFLRDIFEARLAPMLRMLHETCIIIYTI